ncbi:MAG: hypothetical protein HQL46_16660 [Gammaproteobacteria bacterium]|nr:hypothetical protein [Gammaproteobacteria bacterium]
MYATEFETIITHSSIQIPDYQNFKNKQVRVIILEKESEQELQNTDDFISKITKNPKHVSSDVKFLSRDKANER